MFAALKAVGCIILLMNNYWMGFCNVLDNQGRGECYCVARNTDCSRKSCLARNFRLVNNLLADDKLICRLRADFQNLL